MINLSIAISYSGDRLSHFSRSINSIYYQKSSFENVELILLNDGGAEKVLHILRQYSGKFPIRYFYHPNPENRYYNSSVRRNFLIQKSRGKIVLITDPEIVHASDSINQILKNFETYGDKIWYCGKVFATSSVIRRDGRLAFHQRKSEEHIQKLLGPDVNAGKPISLSFFKGNRRYREVNPRYFKEFFWCTALSRHLLMKVQGCNEDYCTYGYEDIDLFNRLSVLGVKRRYDPSFQVFHLPHPIRLSPAEQRFWFMYNQQIPKVFRSEWGVLANTAREIRL